MKQFCTLLLFVFSSHFITAQVDLSGALTGTYTTLTTAFSAINTGGGSGAVTATITANHTITAVAVLNQTNYTVTVQPSGIRTVTGSLNGQLIRLNGADNTLINGLNTGGNSLTVRNTNTGTSAAVLQIQADATGNTIQNCTLEGSTQGTNFPFTNGVVVIRATSGSTGCDNNTITGNKIRDASGNLPRNCIVAEGLSSSIMNDNLVISNNEISNFWMNGQVSRGLFSYRYNQAMQITGNSFFQTAARNVSGADTYNEAILIDDGAASTLSAGFVISNNVIGGSAANAGGTAYTISHTGFAGFQGITVNLGSSPVNSIQGNTIKNINFSTGMPYAGQGYWFFHGINVFAGAANIGTTTGNTIGATTGTGSIVLNCNNSTSGSLYERMIVVGGTGTCLIKNNLIGSTTFNQTGTGTGELSGNGIISFNNNVTIESNTIGSTTTAGSIQMTGGSSSSWGRFQGILVDNVNTLIKTNTIQHLVNNIGNGGELYGIAMWNATNGKTQTCENNIIKNLSNATGDDLDVTGILAVSNSGSTITYTLNITGNTISDCMVSPTTTGECDLNAIWVVPRGSSPICYVNGSISNNTIFNMDNQNTWSTAWLNGILHWQLYNGAGMSISNNTIYNLTSSEGVSFGMLANGSANTSLLPAATTLTIQQNTIYNLTNNHASPFHCGICFNGKNVTVSRNKIYDLENPNASTNSTIAGMSFDGGTNTGDYTLSNNMISLGEGVNNDVLIQGIRHDNNPTANLTLFYNSVFIGGTAGGSVNRTACFERQVTTWTVAKDNLFYNARTGAGGHYAIANTPATPATGWFAGNSDYNYLVSPMAGTVGLWGSTNQTLAQWRTSSGGDSHSLSRISGMETMPANFFVSTATGNLSVNTGNAGEALFASNGGTPVSVTVDFFGTARSVSNPDIGAHEFATVCGAYAGADVSICDGQSTQLNALPAAAMSYAWSPTTGLSNANIQNPIANPTSSTTYTVTTTFSGGCTATDAVVVTVNTVNAAITPGSSPTFCEGGSVTLTASGGVSYLWSTTETTAAITVSTGGTYSVTVTDANGCTGVASQLVTVLLAPTASISASGATTFCEGGSVTLTASGGNTYLWSTGATTAGITVSTSGNYIVTATAANGCTDTESQSVTVLPNPSASISPSGATTFCEGGSVILTANGGSFYLWNTGATTAAITVSTSNTYTVIVTGANGCTDSESQVVTVHPLPTASITPNGATTFCEGGSVMLTASGGVSYVWSTGATTAAITVSNSGTYTVTATDANGCTDSESQVVTVNSLPTASITPNGATTFCQGGSVMLTASGGVSYVWSTGATTAAITASNSGTYIVTATDGNGCTDTESQVVTVNPLPTASITPNGATTFCAGGSVMLTASGGVSYVWSTGATMAAITVSNSGTYIVTATDANGCTDTESQVVTVNPLPTASISGASSICNGETITLTASGGISYSWSTGATTASIQVSATGTYSVTATDANGCTDDASHVVSATDPLACDDDGDNFSENGGDCNDANPAIFPGATETCNSLDDDCDTQIDEGVLLTFFQDSDGDTYGNAAVSQQACSAPNGYVANDDDCDDANPAINPAASEVCNNVDDDCSGSPEAAMNIWTGNGDGVNWTDEGNWSDGIVPLSCQDVVIPAGMTVTISAGFNAVGKTLDVALSAILQVDLTATLDVEN